MRAFHLLSCCDSCSHVGPLITSNSPNAFYPFVTVSAPSTRVHWFSITYSLGIGSALNGPWFSETKRPHASGLGTDPDGCHIISGVQCWLTVVCFAIVTLRRSCSYRPSSAVFYCITTVVLIQGPHSSWHPLLTPCAEAFDKWLIDGRPT